MKSKTDFRIVSELPKKNIDTGMGMERVAFIKQGVDNMYEIDQVRPVLDRAAAALRPPRTAPTTTTTCACASSPTTCARRLMLMSDGVTPGNEGRGYILRRLLRRIIRAMRLLGVEGPTFRELFEASRDAMKAAYPDVETRLRRTSSLALGEEETFLAHARGGHDDPRRRGREDEEGRHGELAGDTTFLLHDTFGFPIDLTLEIAEEAGLTVDRAAFDTLMTEQRTPREGRRQVEEEGARRPLRLRRLPRQGRDGLHRLRRPRRPSRRVLGILVDGRPVPVATAGQTAEVILAETSLYAESGGQAADQGRIVGDGFDLEVLDVQKPVKGLISHTVKVTSGEVGVGDAATTLVDEDYRRGATQAHSGTHLVHAALRQMLGPECAPVRLVQQGRVPAARLRLELRALARDAQRDRGDLQQRDPRQPRGRHARDDRSTRRRSLGAMALFGEKYGDIVRVVDIGGPWSRELCAGTHVRTSAEVGLINIVGESSVGASNRRVESLVGLDAFRRFAAERAIVSELTSTLKTRPEQLVDRVGELVASLKAAEKRIAAFEAKALNDRVPALAANGCARRRGPPRRRVRRRCSAPATNCARSPPPCAASSATRHPSSHSRRRRRQAARDRRDLAGRP